MYLPFKEMRTWREFGYISLKNKIKFKIKIHFVSKLSRKEGA